jgi:hypothetical protein
MQHACKRILDADDYLCGEVDGAIRQEFVDGEVMPWPMQGKRTT